MRAHSVQISVETRIDIVRVYGSQLIDDGFRFIVFADLAKATREFGQRRRKFVVQFRDLELGNIQLDADACPQAP